MNGFKLCFKGKPALAGSAVGSEMGGKERNLELVGDVLFPSLWIFNNAPGTSSVLSIGWNFPKSYWGLVSI